MDARNTQLIDACQQVVQAVADSWNRVMTSSC